MGSKKVQLLSDCIQEARRFIQSAESAINRECQIDNSQWKPSRTKEFAATKRAALDLKQALTPLNKTIWML